MGKPFVFVSRPINKEAEELLAKHCDYKIWNEPKRMTKEQLIEQLKNADGWITGGETVDDELLQVVPNLKVISNISVGYNNFDTDALKKHGKIATNTPYVLDDTVADLIFALMLATARRVPELDKMVKEGRWVKGIDDKQLYGVDVHHAKLGIVGMGRIGEAVAKRARFGFDMEVSYYNRSRKPKAEQELGVTYMELRPLLEQSDFVVLMTPLTKETEKLMDREKFSWMKPNSIFINASRGQTVDEDALVEALENGTIRGAGLDVFCEEPVPADHPLLKFDNVVTLPHIGSATEVTRKNMVMTAVQNMVDALSGKKPSGLIAELQ